MTEYISREAALEAIKKHKEEMAKTGGVSNKGKAFYLMGQDHAIDVLRIIDPATDVKPVVRGEWIKCGRDGRPLCSKCGYEPLEITREYIVDGKLHSWDGAYNLSNFCPNCGAEMARGNGGQG